MAKRNTKMELTEADQRKMLARINWERNVAEMAEGRRQRAATFSDRRKKASREGCRKNRRGEWV